MHNNKTTKKKTNHQLYTLKFIRVSAKKKAMMLTFASRNKFALHFFSFPHLFIKDHTQSYSTSTAIDMCSLAIPTSARLLLTHPLCYLPTFPFFCYLIHPSCQGMLAFDLHLQRMINKILQMHYRHRYHHCHHLLELQQEP